jgi:hypothetical protein
MDYTIFGAPNVPGNIPAPRGTKHLEEPEKLAKKAEEEKAKKEGTTAKDSPHPPDPDKATKKPDDKRADTGGDKRTSDKSKSPKTDNGKGKIKISDNNSSSPPKDTSHSMGGKLSEGVKVDNRSDHDVSVEHQAGAYPL